MKRSCFLRLLQLLIILYALPAGTAMAAEAGWRPTYDLIMMWVNFFIFVAILVKLLKTPLKNFLKGQSESAGREIALVEAEKKKIEEEIAAVKAALLDEKDRLERLKERIIAEGERKKELIIEDAKRQADNLIEVARRRAAGQLAEAVARVRSQLVDMAIATAMKRLPGEISEKDSASLIEHFLSEARKI